MRQDGIHGLASEFRRGPIATVLTLIGIAALVLSGCSSEALAKTEAQRDFADMIEGILQEAEAGGAGDAQLAILRNAQVSGVVSIEDDRTVAYAMISCVEDAGSEAFYQEQTTEAGLVRPVVNSLANTPEQMAISDACDTKEHFWVDGAYQMQPISIAQNDAYLDQQAPVVRSCLEREGYEVDADVSTHDLLRRAAQAKVDSEARVDCLAEAGIESF